jgi:glutathione S-transferase
MTHALVSLVTLISLMVFFWTGLRVGRARGTFGIKAPATTGHDEFERHFRVQMNTLEGIVIYLPALWIFAVFGSEPIAAGLGVIWIIGRIIYAVTYVRDPAKRSAGFAISGLAMLVLLLGSLFFVGKALIAPGA